MSTTGVLATEIDRCECIENSGTTKSVRKFLNGKRRGDRVVVSFRPQFNSFRRKKKKRYETSYAHTFNFIAKKPSLTVTLSPLETLQKVFACYGYLVRTFCK